MFGLVPFAGRKDLARHDDGFGGFFDMFREPFFQNALAPFAGAGSASFKVDVKDKEKSYELTAELPGVKKEDISLHYQDSYLTISAKKDESKEEKDDEGNYIRRERSVGSFSRSFYINDIDHAAIKAEFKDGVLKVDLPKTAAAEKAKQIEIQ